MNALRTILDPSEWDVHDHPRDLARMIANRYGVIPEASIVYRLNKRVMYFEVKKQGPAGNAEERACKHHTVQFYKELHEVTNLHYHPFVTIMCDSLAVLDRYTVKAPYYFEEDHYFEWVQYDLDQLADFLAKITTQWMTGSDHHATPTVLPE